MTKWLLNQQMKCINQILVNQMKYTRNETHLECFTKLHTIFMRETFLNIEAVIHPFILLFLMGSKAMPKKKDLWKRHTLRVNDV